MVQQSTESNFLYCMYYVFTGRINRVCNLLYFHFAEAGTKICTFLVKKNWRDAVTAWSRIFKSTFLHVHARTLFFAAVVAI
jgi:hypothetical protein